MNSCDSNIVINPSDRVLSEYERSVLVGAFKGTEIDYYNTDNIVVWDNADRFIVSHNVTVILIPFVDIDRLLQLPNPTDNKGRRLILKVAEEVTSKVINLSYPIFSKNIDGEDILIDRYNHITYSDFSGIEIESDGTNWIIITESY